jgi:hypothetical protein
MYFEKREALSGITVYKGLCFASCIAVVNSGVVRHMIPLTPLRHIFILQVLQKVLEGRRSDGEWQVHIL